MARRFKPRWYVDPCKVVFLATIVLNLGCVVAFDIATNPQIEMADERRDQIRSFVKGVVIPSTADTQSTRK